MRKDEAAVRPAAFPKREGRILPETNADQLLPPENAEALSVALRSAEARLQKALVWIRRARKHDPRQLRFFSGEIREMYFNIILDGVTRGEAAALLGARDARDAVRYVVREILGPDAPAA